MSAPPDRLAIAGAAAHGLQLVVRLVVVVAFVVGLVIGWCAR